MNFRLPKLMRGKRRRRRTEELMRKKKRKRMKMKSCSPGKTRVVYSSKSSDQAEFNAMI